MPKVMTIGSLKDALPAGSYQGPIGRLRSLGALVADDMVVMEGRRARSVSGLGNACAEFGYTSRTRTVWKCPSKKKRSRAARNRECKKVEMQTRELVCLSYDQKLTRPGITSAHKRAAVCKSPRRKLKKSR